VSSAKGHPQWRRNVTIVGRPSFAGKGSCVVDGALVPTVGGAESGVAGGDHQDEYSW
jgi:hypothetical protein